ncbi:DUF4231 domain-containing protein [Aminobacter ciceronei]|uniref:DUF4231 domain-containing protein n=1 Tax=Aminobacter ciceronei TaxID=150723 RepID=A0ABR6C9I0_9HYPH|nr:DUF4231 domain-containing protein [Aminobacter ciceronei]MBA8907905.1 hypothetical protein [Aminobacter ciceronei]MBA9021677.1 hypothetical protein [Aminobacter ciceronei]
MTQDEYPALYQSADSSSADAQWTYLLLLRLQYGLLFLAAFISLWFGGTPDIYIFYVFVVGTSTALLIYTSVQKPEKDWYACRALAESIKTSTWRYMMRAEPFEDSPKISTVKSKFSRFLKEILDANSHVRDPISKKPSTGDQITKAMNATRALSLEDRINRYRTERIEEQRRWYVSKVKTNRRHFRGWVIFCVIVQGAAIGLAMLRIRYDQQWSLWPTEPLLVLASAVVGWIQIKKFNELASAYSLTAHEIGILLTRIDHVKTEEDFSLFVNDAERAFSREHTQWVARQTEENL